MENNCVELYKKNYDAETETNFGSAKKNKKCKKKHKRYGKRIYRQIKKMNKQLRKIIHFFQSQKEKNKNVNDSFFYKAGDAVVKVIPTILTTSVTTLFSFIFKGKSSKRSPQYGWAAG